MEIWNITLLFNPVLRLPYALIPHLLGLPGKDAVLDRLSCEPRAHTAFSWRSSFSSEPQAYYHSALPAGSCLPKTGPPMPRRGCCCPQCQPRQAAPRHPLLSNDTSDPGTWLGQLTCIYTLFCLLGSELWTRSRSWAPSSIECLPELKV